MSDMFQDRANRVSRAKTVDSDIINKTEAPIPDNMWVKCNSCARILYRDDLSDNLNVCTACGNHFRLSAKERLEMTVDTDTFTEINADIVGCDPLNFPGYKEKCEGLRKKTKLNDAIITGVGDISGIKAVFGFMDSNFLMGSMGAAVGEKLAMAFEYATEHKLPVIVFTVSGGARMQEGIVSLMQMAKVSGAVAHHSRAGLLYITVLTDPTTGGVTASFAMQGDIIISEPGALIGFAGKRVIEQTIKQSLPEGFQTAEFLSQKGFVDSIIERKNMRKTLHGILHLHQGRKH
ncbi:MAG: acetyl-CoA carboxylase, carboxyltransferase subunit beta [Bacillota bacterium]